MVNFQKVNNNFNSNPYSNNNNNYINQNNVNFYGNNNVMMNNPNGSYNKARYSMPNNVAQPIKQPLMPNNNTNAS